MYHIIINKLVKMLILFLLSINNITIVAILALTVDLLPYRIVMGYAVLVDDINDLTGVVVEDITDDMTGVERLPFFSMWFITQSLEGSTQNFLLAFVVNL